jgi:hypothetical protein
MMGACAAPLPNTNHRLVTAELARRWRMSPRTLEQWRWKRIGPRYLKVGGRVLYCLSDVEDFETAQRREAT